MTELKQDISNKKAKYQESVEWYIEECLKDVLVYMNDSDRDKLNTFIAEIIKQGGTNAE